MEELIKNIEQAYKDCDTLVDRMIEARLAHDKEAEMRIFRQMESQTVCTMQEYTVILDFLKELLKRS